MVTALAPEREMRGAGCDDRCKVVKVIAQGVFGRSELLLHDAEAHEAYGRWQAGAVDGETGRVVMTGRLSVNLRSLEVTVDRQPVALSPTELRLLVLLAREPGQTVPTREIVGTVWGIEYLDVRSPVWRHMLRATLNRLRGRIHPDGELIVTVPGVGLRLDAVPLGDGPRPAVAHPKARHGHWAQAWDRCRRCGRTKLPHNGNGLCTGCYASPRRRAERASGAKS